MRMQQSQTIQQSTVGNQLVNTPTANTQQTSIANFSQQQSTDFSLEFLDLPTTDTGAYTDQELLNSFDTDSGFNLDF